MLRVRARRSLVLGLVAAAALLGCTPARDPSAVPGHAEKGQTSLFERPWTWTDEQGQTVTFAQWRGAPIVVTTIYTTCVRTCPQTIADLRKVFEAFRRESRAAQFVLVTLDPHTDTPSRLREFKEAQSLPAAWHLLAGTERQTRELTDLLDVHVMDADAHVFHDAKITIAKGDGALAWSFGRGELGAGDVRLPGF